MQRCIGDVYGGMDLTCETFPGDDQVDPAAYKDAVKSFKAGDVAVIFTPDGKFCSIINSFSESATISSFPSLTP